MISYESEREALEGAYGMIVPFLVSVYKGETTIEAYDGAREQVNKILSRCHGSYFNKASIDLIDELLEPYVNRLGYYREVIGKYKWYEVYGAESAERLNLSCVRENTRILSEEHLTLTNLTNFDLNELLALPFPSCIVIDDNKIVALASVNPCSEEQRVLELTVETSSDYRRKGYGISATVKLADHLLRDGYIINYVCSRYNRPSILLAKKCGFEKMGRIYAYTAYED